MSKIWVKLLYLKYGSSMMNNHTYMYILNAQYTYTQGFIIQNRSTYITTVSMYQGFRGICNYGYSTLTESCINSYITKHIFEQCPILSHTPSLLSPHSRPHPLKPFNLPLHLTLLRSPSQTVAKNSRAQFSTIFLRGGLFN